MFFNSLVISRFVELYHVGVRFRLRSLAACGRGAGAGGREVTC